MTKKHTNPNYRLLIRIIDRSLPSRIDQNGNTLIPTKWIEVPEANFGSVSKPNKEIIEFKLEPVKYEKGKDTRNFQGFKRLNIKDLKELKDFFNSEDED